MPVNQCLLCSTGGQLQDASNGRSIFVTCVSNIRNSIRSDLFQVILKDRLIKINHKETYSDVLGKGNELDGRRSKAGVQDSR